MKEPKPRLKTRPVSTVSLPRAPIRGCFPIPTAWVKKSTAGKAKERTDAAADKIKEDLDFRKERAEKCGFGFKLPSVVPNVPRIDENQLIATAA